MRCIRHKRIWKSYFYYSIYELFRIDDSRICNYRKPLFISYSFYKFCKLTVFHLIADFFISQETTVYRKCSMKRIKTGAYLHSLHHIYNFTLCKHYSAFFKLRSAVWEAVLYYKVLRLFRIYKRCHKCILACLNKTNILYTVFNKHIHYGVSRSRCYFINHRPWETYLFGIFYI